VAGLKFNQYSGNKCPKNKKIQAVNWLAKIVQSTRLIPLIILPFLVRANFVVMMQPLVLTAHSSRVEEKALW
jgi:hypothetical protein